MATSYEQHLIRGGEFLRSDRPVDAEAEFVAALREKPDDTRVLGLLGLAYFRGEKFENALPVYEKLVFLEAEDAAHWLNLGLVQLRLENASSAVEALSQSHDLNPSELRTLTYLGLAYARGGLFDRAFETFLLSGDDQLAQEMETRVPPDEREFIIAQVVAKQALSHSKRASAAVPGAPTSSQISQGTGNDAFANALMASGDDSAPSSGEPSGPDGDILSTGRVQESVLVEESLLSAEPSSNSAVGDGSAPKRESSGPPPPPGAAPGHALGEATSEVLNGGPELGPAGRVADAMPHGARKRSHTGDAVAGFPRGSEPVPLQAEGDEGASISAAAPLVRAPATPPLISELIADGPETDAFEVVRRRSIRLPSVDEPCPFVVDTEAGDGTVAVAQVRGLLFSRTAGLIAHSGIVETHRALRRNRGAEQDITLGTEDEPLFRCEGDGRLIFSGARQFVVCTIDGSPMYVREQDVHAFESRLTWEHGFLPVTGISVPMLSFRGEGAVLLGTKGSWRSLPVSEAYPAQVRLGRLMGWIGKVVPHPITQHDQSWVECVGEGYVFIDIVGD